MRCDNYVIVYSVETYRIKNYVTAIRIKPYMFYTQRECHRQGRPVTVL